VIAPEHESEIAAKKRRRRKASGFLHEGIFQDYDDELEGEVVTDVSPSPPALKERACSFVDLLKQAISNATRRFDLLFILSFALSRL
jgi:hypothetical protein